MIGDEGTAPDKCPDDGEPLPLQVLQSAAGFYIGTSCPQCGPYSRASDYFPTREAAEAELAEWDTVRPSARTPGFNADADLVVIPIASLADLRVALGFPPEPPIPMDPEFVTIYPDPDMTVTVLPPAASVAELLAAFGYDDPQQEGTT